MIVHKTKNNEVQERTITATYVKRRINCNGFFLFFLKTLALGSQFGKIYMWDLETDDPSDIKRQVISNPKSKKLIRSIALSLRGREMIAVNDEGEIFIWKKNL